MTCKDEKERAKGGTCSHEGRNHGWCLKRGQRHHLDGKRIVTHGARHPLSRHQQVIKRQVINNGLRHLSTDDPPTADPQLRRKTYRQTAAAVLIQMNVLGTAGLRSQQNDPNVPEGQWCLRGGGQSFFMHTHAHTHTRTHTHAHARTHAQTHTHECVCFCDVLHSTYHITHTCMHAQSTLARKHTSHPQKDRERERESL